MNFRQFISEALDISIQAAGKWLTSQKKIDEFLTSPVTVEHKTDGVKITVMKTGKDEYVIAYKGSILYATEYDYQPMTKIKKESIGSSQFKTIFDHFNKLSSNNIPVGTELFVEFLMSKPTLSSNYTKKHKMVLIGHSKSSWSEKFGKLTTKHSGMRTDKRDEYAKVLKIDTPALLFDGVMGSQPSFEKGIVDPVLKSEFSARKLSMSWDNPTLLVDDIRSLFLDIESKYGGKEEGVVIKFNDKILKFQQEYQLDQEARAKIKMKYRHDSPEDETQYWNNVTRTSLSILNGMTIKSRKLDDLLGELSVELKRLKLDFGHAKKTDAMIKDDIQLTTKTQIIKNMRGNNNALIIGKFRVLTKEGHAKMIKRASTLYDNVVIAIITSKDTKETKDLREKMMKAAFPNAEIIHASNANIPRLFAKTSTNINVVYAGSDRVESYQKQLKSTLGVTVKEMPRTDDDISASKVIKNINDKEYFLQHTPKEIHHMYDEIAEMYS